MDLIITLKDWTGHPGVPCPVDCLKLKPCKYNCVPFSGDHHRAGKESRETHVLLFEGRDRESSFDINFHHLELLNSCLNLTKVFYVRIAVPFMSLVGHFAIISQVTFSQWLAFKFGQCQAKGQLNSE